MVGAEASAKYWRGWRFIHTCPIGKPRQSISVGSLNAGSVVSLVVRLFSCYRRAFSVSMCLVVKLHLSGLLVRGYWKAH